MDLDCVFEDNPFGRVLTGNCVALMDEMAPGSADLIFADPPYSFKDYLSLRESVIPLLNDDGSFCMETSKRTKTDGTEHRVREFGNTKIIFWRNKS